MHGDDREASRARLARRYAEIRALSETLAAPLCWRGRDGEPSEFGLTGQAPLDDDAQVRHVSHYEAAAHAGRSGKRLPAEAKWGAVASAVGECTRRGRLAGA